MAKWWLVTWTTYGSWLPGDKCGFRTRRGREYVPPPARNALADEPTYKLDDYADRPKRAKYYCPDPVILTAEEMQLALPAIVEEIESLPLKPLILAVGKTHFHLIAQFGRFKIRPTVGRLKAAATRKIPNPGNRKRIWTEQCNMHSLNNDRELANAFAYVRDHENEGALIYQWCDDDDRPQDDHSQGAPSEIRPQGAGLGGSSAATSHPSPPPGGGTNPSPPPGGGKPNPSPPPGGGITNPSPPPGASNPHPSPSLGGGTPNPSPPPGGGTPNPSPSLGDGNTYGGNSPMIANIQGVNIFHEITGDGPVIVFVHGLGGTGNVWFAQRTALSKYFKVVTLDLPGSGQSDKSEDSYSMNKWVDQIAALADHAGLDKFTLVGHSMATVLVQNFAAKHGKRLDALVLCGPITELPPPGKEAFIQRAETVRKEGMIAIADQVLQGALTARTREANPALTGLLRDMLLSNCPNCYAGHCDALREGSAKADQPNIKVPTLILDGDQDPVTPLKAARGVASAIANARIRIVPDTAHMTMLERPDAFNAALIEFLAQVN